MNKDASKTRLSVVIPCYNSQDWIGRAIQSALDAGCDDLILVVSDDGSTDGSAEAVRAFGDRVILLSGPNRGACHARNAGMEIAKAKGATHVLFLDADDYLEGDALAGAAEVAGRTGADIILSHNHIQFDDGRRLERRVYSGQVTPEDFFEGWMTGKHFAPVAVLLRIDFVEKMGGWDESLSRAQDTDLFLRMMFERPVIMMNDRGAAIYNMVNPGSVSRNVSPKSTEARIRVISRLLEKMKGTSFEPLMPLMLQRLYGVTRAAFQMKQTELGRKGVKVMAAYGYRKHPGTRSHSLLSSLIGLEAKVRLWGN
ncbi:glycosyltransferase [Tabrizicola sp. J26]|uniref:glycosyltransferase family 2 protein n=1 Tax=Alitabrizicola rongguiensis TaxID=2909234 RepID=UPI001F3B967F|nr:glycosyltransferase [Tabrizicola rongguiensis]MCF1711096.1 glycosyltransferase [Tabrizicola rongguiensis]